MTAETQDEDLILSPAPKMNNHEVPSSKVHSSCQRSMLAHKFSASKIEETELENRFSNLLRLEADKLLHLHLICLFLVFHLRCCNGFSLKPTVPR